MTQDEVLTPPNRLESCCRLCLSGDEPAANSTSLFPVHDSPDHRNHHHHHHHHSPGATEQRLLIEMILECTSIQITLEEDYPAKVCEKCVETLDKFYQYRRRCLANDQLLRLERLRAAGTGRKPPNNNNNNNEDDGEPPTPTLLHGRRSSTPASSSGESSHHVRPRASSPQPPPVMVVPAIRIKSEPQPLDTRGDGGGEGEEQQPGHDSQPAASTTDAGGVSSILRSILLQTRDSTASRASPNTDSESPRQTPQLPPPAAAALPAAVEIVRPGQQHHREDLVQRVAEEEEEKDIKPSLLQQMLQQCGASSPANRSPAKPLDNSTGPGQDASLAGSNTATGSSSTSSSLLKRMLLDGGTANAEQLAPPPPPPPSASPLEGPSGQPHQRTAHLRTKPEPPSATNTPSPPAPPIQRTKEDDELTNETPLASQLRSILLQHRATGWDGATRTSLSDASPELQPDRRTNAPNAFEKPEVSYVRSLFLRNDSDSESEPPPVEDQREMLLYAMFHELRTRQQQQQQQQQQQNHQPSGGFSSDSDDDSDDLPQDYRLPSVRRRSTDSVEPRNKRRRMEYPCLLCGRTFAGKTKLIVHMRTHMMLEGGTDAGTASSGATISLPSVSPAISVPGGGGGPGGLLPNGGGVSDAEDVAGGGRLLTAPSQQQQQHHAASSPFGENAGNEDEIDALERRSYACYICGADQNNLTQLKEHLLAAHQDRIRSRGRTRERQKASIACEICQRTFRSQFAYGEHMRTHTGERPFPCDQCDKRFPRRFQLLGHLYNVHKQSWVADETKAKFAKK